jgi:hypothetical protein
LTGEKADVMKVYDTMNGSRWDAVVRVLSDD